MVSCNGHSDIHMSVVPGSIVTCSCVGEGDRMYQWYRSGEPIAGETDRDCIIHGFGNSDQGLFQCSANGALSDNIINLAIFEDYQGKSEQAADSGYSY